MKRFSLILLLLLSAPLYAGRSFNGSSDLITANGSGVLNIPTGPMTISLWAYPTTVGDAEHDLINKWGSSSANQQFILGFGLGLSGEGPYSIGTSIGPPFSETGNYDFIGNSSTILPNEWYQIVIWADPSGIYGSGPNFGILATRNGTLLANTSSSYITENRTSSMQSVIIGSRPPGNTFAGTIAEVAIWNAVLSPSERAALANVCPSGIRRASIVGYWPLWGASGTSIEPDLSGNVNNGALTGTSSANHPPCTPAPGGPGGGGASSYPAPTVYSDIASSASGWQNPPCSTLNPVSPPAASCAGDIGIPVSDGTVNTTTTEAISSTGSQTVAVASSAGLAVNQGILLGGSNSESVKVTGVGSGTITATFSQTHASGVSVQCCFTTQTFGNTSPVIDTGEAMLIGFDGESLTGGHTTNVLWPWKGTYNASLLYFRGYYNVEFPSVSNIQAAEYDQFLFAGGYRAMQGSQCVKSGDWDIWNSQGGSWVDSGLACNLLTTANTVQHIIWDTHLDPSSSTACSGYPCIHYDKLTLNGVVHALNLTQPYSTSSDGNAVGIQPQIDCSEAGGTCSEYVDQDMELEVSPYPFP